MTIKLPQNDPIKVHQLKTTAARRIGVTAKCACGEARPEALKKRGNLVICAVCDRKAKGHSITDAHHPAGEANSPITVDIPTNDHQAVLNVAQYDWPAKTLENPDGCPVLALAARIRGFVDTAVYLIEKLLNGAASLLEALHVFLVSKFGPKWWVGTPLEKFAPPQ
jgi:hypothetical protein